MKNFFQCICFALSVCLMTACHTHQPLSVDNDEVNAHCEEHESALIAAASNGDHDAVNSLLEHGADSNIPDKNGWTALMWAAENGHAASVEALLEHGADPDSDDYIGLTALIVAAIQGHEASVTMLEEASRRSG